VIVDRDNNSAPGENAEDENLMPAWAKADKSEREVETSVPDRFQSNEEPRRGLEPFKIGLMEDRFEYLSGKKLVKEEKIVQRYRFSPIKADANPMLAGLGTRSTRENRNGGRVPVLPASMETFVQAIESLAEQHQQCEVEFIGAGGGDTSFGPHTLASFPTHNPRKRKRIGWAWIKTENRPRRVAIAEIRLAQIPRLKRRTRGKSVTFFERLIQLRRSWKMTL
jgi:hypothetical protein